MGNNELKDIETQLHNMLQTLAMEHCEKTGKSYDEAKALLKRVIKEWSDKL